MHRRRKPSITPVVQSATSKNSHQEPSDPDPSDLYSNWSTAIAALLLGVVVFCVYARTASKGVTGGDSGELMAVACQRGVAHPPGYPSFVLLSQLVLALPWGQPHHRVAWLSCALSACASVLVLLTVVLVWGREGNKERAGADQVRGPTGSSSGAGGAPIAVSRRDKHSAHRPPSTGGGEQTPACNTWGVMDNLWGGLRGLAFASWERSWPTWAGLLSAAAYSSSPLIWTYGNQAEVFALNNACVAGLMYIMARFYQNPSVTTAYAGALLAGFAATNQHTVFLFLLPAVTISLWLHRGLLARPKVMATCLLMVLVGLLPYTHLVAAARNTSRQYSWGATGTWSGLLTHVSRAEYGTLRLTRSMASADRGLAQWILRILDYMWDFAVVQGAIICAPAALAGIGSSLCRRPGGAKPPPAGDQGGDGKSQAEQRTGGPNEGTAAVAVTARRDSVRRFHLAVLLSWAFYLLAFHYLSNISLSRPLLFAVQARFWQQPNITLFLYVGPGVMLLLRQFRGTLASTLGAFVWALVVLRAAMVFRQVDRSDSSYLQDVAMSALESLPPSAIVVSSGEENFMPLAYVQSCLGVRRDVSLLSRELLTYPWFKHQQGRFYADIQFPGTRLWRREAHRPPPEPGTYDLSQFFRANMVSGSEGRQRVIFVQGGRRANHLHTQMSDDSLQQCGLTAYPQGLLERVYSGTCHPTAERLMVNHWGAITHLLPRVNESSLPDTQRFQEDSWEWFVVDDYWSLYYRMAWRMLQYAFFKAEGHAYVEEGNSGTAAGSCDSKALVDRTNEIQMAYASALHLFQLLERADVAIYRRTGRRGGNDRDASRKGVGAGYDLTFHGYIYKNMGFIYKVIGNHTDSVCNYKRFLSMGPSWDPDLKLLQNEVRTMEATLPKAAQRICGM